MSDTDNMAENVCKKPGAGRPKDSRKHAAILDAARQHFLEHGFGRANMDAIAESAGVSKLTVYSHFQNKEALFREIIRAKCEQFRCEATYEQARHMTLEDGIHAIAQGFLQMVCHEEALRIHRVVIGECTRYPAMARMFYDTGPIHQKELFTAHLEFVKAQGWLDASPIPAACEHFFSLLKGCFYIRMLLGIEENSEAAIRAHAHECAVMFLRAYQ